MSASAVTAEAQIQELQVQIDGITKSQLEIDSNIDKLRRDHEDLEDAKTAFLAQIESLLHRHHRNRAAKKGARNKNKNQNRSDRANELRCVQYQTKQAWDAAVMQSMRSIFKLSSFRPYQREIINCTLRGEDVFAILPSGSGKSLCYQIPTTLSQPYTREGVTLVVSPLVSLMIDQCYQLKKLGIKAGSIYGSDKSREENQRIYSNLKGIEHGERCEYKMVYVTPEKVTKSKRLMNHLEIAYHNDRFDRIVIDEAHCCSQWGHDFRSDYKKLHILRQQFPDVPILACTATATDHIVQDTINILKMKNPAMFRGSFNRPNLFYDVRPKPSAKKDALQLVANIISADEFDGKSGIVYGTTINECVAIYEYLREKKISALPYYGDLDTQMRENIQTKWLENQCQVVVATIAFGLGINKPDVAFVIHYSISQSMQNYYQESGRAGRDGDTSRCILLYKAADIFGHIIPMVSGKQNFRTLVRPLMEYCHSVRECRRHLMAKSFGEQDEITARECNGQCDICAAANADADDDDGGDDTEQPQTYETRDITEAAILITKILQHVEKDARGTKNKLTMPQLVEVWRGGSGGKNTLVKELVQHFKIDKMKTSQFSKSECEYIIGQLYVEHFVDVEIRHTQYQAICVMVPGKHAHLMNEHLVRQQQRTISVDIPLLSRRKQKQQQKEKEKDKKKASKRTKSKKSESTNTNTNLKQEQTDNDDDDGEEDDGNAFEIAELNEEEEEEEKRIILTSASASHQSVIESNSRVIESNSRKRKRDEISISSQSQGGMVNLCSDDSDESLKLPDKHESPMSKECKQNSNNSHEEDKPARPRAPEHKKKKKKRKKLGDGWDLDSSESDGLDDIFMRSKKRKQKKRKKKRKQKSILTDDEDDDSDASDDINMSMMMPSNNSNTKSKSKQKEKLVHSEPPTRKKRKLVAVPPPKPPPIKYEYDDEDTIPNKFVDGSLEYTLYYELRIWNRFNSDDTTMQSQPLNKAKTIDIVDNVQHVISVGANELLRILGQRDYNKFGVTLLKEVKRINLDWRTNNNSNKHMHMSVPSGPQSMMHLKSESEYESDPFRQHHQQQPYEQQVLPAQNPWLPKPQPPLSQPKPKVKPKPTIAVKRRNKKSPSMLMSKSFCVASKLSHDADADEIEFDDDRSFNIAPHVVDLHRKRRNTMPAHVHHAKNMTTSAMMMMDASDDDEVSIALQHQSPFKSLANNNAGAGENIGLNGFEYPNDSDHNSDDDIVCELTTPESESESPLLHRLKKTCINSNRTNNRKLNISNH